MRRAFKFASLVPICLLTWFSTNAILAQFQRQIPKKTPVAMQALAPSLLQGKVSAVEYEAGQKPVQSAQPLDAASVPVANQHLLSFKMEVAGGTATVAAQVSLSDQQGRNLYLWRLSLLDGQGDTLDQIIYDHQTFGMEADGVMEPTFHEVVDLLPGAKMVQLSLFAFPPGTDLGIFRDPAASNGYLVIRRVQGL